MLDPEEENDIAVAPISSHSEVRVITWDFVKEETSKDKDMVHLTSLIQSEFPEDKKNMPLKLQQYWDVRNKLHVVDSVVVMIDELSPPLHTNGIARLWDRIVLPPSLRPEILSSLHAAHQGTTGMNERAKTSVYWPGITEDINTIRRECQSCNRITPSHAKIPPVAPSIPSTPFEAIACDYFHYLGYYHFVAADRLSGWLEVSQINVGTNEAGAQGLCKALRRLMVTFGVPREISSDAGP